MFFPAPRPLSGAAFCRNVRPNAAVACRTPNPVRLSVLECRSAPTELARSIGWDAPRSLLLFCGTVGFEARLSETKFVAPLF